MNAREFAAAVQRYEAEHPEYTAAKRAWQVQEKAYRAFCNSLLPRFEVTTEKATRYAPGAWGIANRDWRYR